MINNVEQICRRGREVILIEANMVKNLVERIDHSFAKACAHLFECTGHVSVMGVGKSGHIGRKMAATFSSTGTPAFFVHPVEAKHGDMGMVTQKDVVILISNSGETEEIISLLPSLKRLHVPIIALTGRPFSSLAQAADVHLDTSVSQEACPLGLAPTASTTTALVMGDALAMALLEIRGFSEKDFALSHPGGMLGKRLLLRVCDIMHKGDEVPTVAHNISFKEALLEMTRKKLGMTTIVDEKQSLLGIFTDGDVRRALDKEVDMHTTCVMDIMSANPKTISPDILAVEALNIMETFKITSLVVIDAQKKVLGILHIHDLLRAGVA